MYIPENTDRSICTTEVIFCWDNNNCIITLDQAVYTKAIEIVWKKEAEFNNIVLWMGAFHICTMFLAVLGSRFGDAGLTDPLVESKIIGPSAVKAVMLGKHYMYNRAG